MGAGRLHTSYCTTDGAASTRGTSMLALGNSRSEEEDQMPRAGGGKAPSSAPPMDRRGEAGGRPCAPFGMAGAPTRPPMGGEAGGRPCALLGVAGGSRLEALGVPAVERAGGCGG